MLTIISMEGCPRCTALKSALPDAEVVRSEDLLSGACQNVYRNDYLTAITMDGNMPKLFDGDQEIDYLPYLTGQA